VTFYRLILLIDIFTFLVVTAVCLFFIKVLQQQQQFANTSAQKLRHRDVTSMFRWRQYPASFKN